MSRSSTKPSTKSSTQPSPKPQISEAKTQVKLSSVLPIECQKIIASDAFSDKICIFGRFWDVPDCNESPRSLFVFGDNDVEKGCGGQAVIRPCRNAIGIPTKKYPSNRSDSFYTDAEYESNCQKVTDAIELIIFESKKYDEIVFPSDGFGTGLASLATRAPKTLKFINDMVAECFGVEYENIKKNGLQLGLNPAKVDSAKVDLSKLEGSELLSKTKTSQPDESEQSLSDESDEEPQPVIVRKDTNKAKTSGKSR